MNKEPLKLRDFIFIGLISVAFGIVYLIALYLGAALTTALTPVGIGILGYEPFYGIWFMAPVVALYVLRRPSVGIITEIFAAVIEVVLGNIFGPIVIVSAFIQGLGVELPYMFTKYRRYNMRNSMVGAVLATIFSFIWTAFRNDYASLEISIVIAIFVIRLISSLIFTGFIAHKLCIALDNTGLLKSYGVSHEKDK
ncbi:ECF transporter S component [Aerococcus viridans]|uniref:ECF transporter S component n=1 Tax=Aerococcus viridans TaxID=1377 RepID=UPI002DB6B10D|nr:ECF transporter S component [Aerococcus viridans]MEC1387261.1 ECF transporter S component [Aerococcus viridans]